MRPGIPSWGSRMAGTGEGRKTPTLHGAGFPVPFSLHSDLFDNHSSLRRHPLSVSESPSTPHVPWQFSPREGTPGISSSFFIVTSLTTSHIDISPWLLASVPGNVAASSEVVDNEMTGQLHFGEGDRKYVGGMGELSDPHPPPWIIVSLLVDNSLEMTLTYDIRNALFLSFRDNKTVSPSLDTFLHPRSNIDMQWITINGMNRPYPL